MLIILYMTSRRSFASPELVTLATSMYLLSNIIVHFSLSDLSNWERPEKGQWQEFFSPLFSEQLQAVPSPGTFTNYLLSTFYINDTSETHLSALMVSLKG